MGPWRGKIAAKQSYKSANARVRSSRRNLGPPTSRAASGGNISPWWRKPTMINVQIGPSYYRPTYTAASQCIGVIGQTRPLAEKMTTSELSNQLTPGSGPQNNAYPPTFRPPPTGEGAPSSGQN